MTRVLLLSTAFVRAARRLMKKHPDAGPDLEATFVALMEDAFQAALKTHKLKGDLAVHGPVVPATTCGLYSRSSSTKTPRPSCCKTSERTMKCIEYIAEPGRCT